MPLKCALCPWHRPTIIWRPIGQVIKYGDGRTVRGRSHLSLRHAMASRGWLSSLLFFTFFVFSTPFWMLAEVGRENFDSPAACRLMPGLTARQRDICARQPDAMKFVVDGLRMALEECQYAFRGHVWNCSFVGSHSLKMASKESAYVYAIASAGVSHSLARACSKGLIEDCGCGPVPAVSAVTPLPKNFVWSGCSDNVRYGNSFGRKFIDISERTHRDSRSMMNIHNNRVGRRLLANSMQKQCKCHGVSGSCVTKTCWKVVPKFNEFAARLFDKYEIAQQVTAAPNSNQLMVRAPAEGGRSERTLKQVDATKAVKNELVFIDASPDYCSVSALDSRGRECGDNCKQICCGRGWHSVREVVDEPCECKFIWCCEVKCKTCKRVVDRNYCR